MGETDSTERDSFRKNATQMTQIPATILAVEKQPGKHRVLVRILLRKYRGSFNTLKFGEDKPVLGSLSARTTGSYLLPRSRSKSGKFVPALDDRVTSVIFRCDDGSLWPLRPGKSHSHRSRKLLIASNSVQEDLVVLAIDILRVSLKTPILLAILGMLRSDSSTNLVMSLVSAFSSNPSETVFPVSFLCF